MKITDLTDEQINYWVAKANRWEEERPQDKQFITANGNRVCVLDKPPILGYEGWHYHPTTNGEQCFELIEKFEIWSLYWDEESNWIAITKLMKEGTAVNPKRAVCLAVIASVYGDEVEK